MIDRSGNSDKRVLPDWNSDLQVNNDPAQEEFRVFARQTIRAQLVLARIREIALSYTVR